MSQSTSSSKETTGLPAEKLGDIQHGPKKTDSSTPLANTAPAHGSSDTTMYRHADGVYSWHPEASDPVPVPVTVTGPVQQAEYVLETLGKVILAADIAPPAEWAKVQDHWTNPDLINHPPHYTSLAGIECIDATEQMNFNIGNAVKYLWRCDLKDSPQANLNKALWYVKRELKRRGLEEERDG